MNDYVKSGLFGIGNPNVDYAKYFVGESYLNPITTTGVGIFNETFESKCRNNWHIHHADKGGGQILLCMSGRGWYQEFGKAPRELHSGNSVVIPINVKHWHGEAKDSWFAHLAVEVPGDNSHTEWCEAVSDDEYNQLGYVRILC